MMAPLQPTRVACKEKVMEGLISGARSKGKLTGRGPVESLGAIWGVIDGVHVPASLGGAAAADCARG